MNLGPEFRLFCLALRRSQNADDGRHMRELAARIKDWGPIVAGARRHRVAPLISAGLRACDGLDVPASVLAELQRMSLANARRSLVQAAEIGRLGRLFGDAGVPVLVLKGEALSIQLYGESGWRTTRDIDLLVDPEQFADAQAVLLKAGYRQHQKLPSHHQAAYLRAIKEVEFTRIATGGLVELHYRLADNHRLLHFPFASLWNKREQVRVGDVAVATLPRHRLPLYLCVHGADHGWSRLQWLVDFSSALSQSKSLGAAFQSADALGLRWPFLHAVVLAHEWLGLPIDDLRIADYRYGAQMRRLEWLLARLYSPTDWYREPPSTSWKRLLHYSLWERLYRFSLKPDWRYRLGQVRRGWVSPADWEAVPLPGPLSFLYPLVRPWGWLLRRLPLFRRRARTLNPQFSSRQRRQPE